MTIANLPLSLVDIVAGIYDFTPILYVLITEDYSANTQFQIRERVGHGVSMMVFQAFFLICLVGIGITLIFFECRWRALMFGSVILGVSYLFEMRGIVSGDWSYEDVDSFLVITDVPIEILTGYFTAGFFLLVLVENIPDISTVERRESFLCIAMLAIGTALLIHSYIFTSMSLAVGWAFLGIFGLMISTDRSITLTVGICAFVADWLVEGMLTGGTNYYSGSWDPTFALVFMFAGMFITGIWQNHKGILRYLLSRTEEGEGT
jgi:hypothetical protein